MLTNNKKYGFSSLVMDVERSMLCVICGNGEKDEDILNQIDKYWDPERGTENPFNTLIAQAIKCGSIPTRTPKLQMVIKINIQHLK